MEDARPLTVRGQGLVDPEVYFSARTHVRDNAPGVVCENDVAVVVFEKTLTRLNRRPDREVRLQIGCLWLWGDLFGNKFRRKSRNWAIRRRTMMA